MGAATLLVLILQASASAMDRIHYDDDIITTYGYNGKMELGDTGTVIGSMTDKVRVQFTKGGKVTIETIPRAHVNRFYVEKLVAPPPSTEWGHYEICGLTMGSHSQPGYEGRDCGECQ